MKKRKRHTGLIVALCMAAVIAGIYSRFGGCEAINRYIHGEGGTAAEALSATGFAIYRTEEMENLVEWMRDYNVSAAQRDDLRFYGFDMEQRSFLDFSKVPEGSALMEYIANSVPMGSLGEYYSILMNFVPRSYRVQRIPQDAYDAMAFVADAAPIEIGSLNK